MVGEVFPPSLCGAIFFSAPCARLLLGVVFKVDHVPAFFSVQFFFLWGRSPPLPPCPRRPARSDRAQGVFCFSGAVDLFYAMKVSPPPPFEGSFFLFVGLLASGNRTRGRVSPVTEPSFQDESLYSGELTLFSVCIFRTEGGQVFRDFDSASPSRRLDLPHSLFLDMLSESFSVTRSLIFFLLGIAKSFRLDFLSLADPYQADGRHRRYRISFV